MRFQVPQFIEVEDKIFGPLTVKQFIYLAGGAGLVFILYHFLPTWISIFSDSSRRRIFFGSGILQSQQKTFHQYGGSGF
jgi:hypothetical protein